MKDRLSCGVGIFFYIKAKEKSFYDKISYHLFLYVKEFGELMQFATSKMGWSGISSPSNFGRSVGARKIQ